MKTPEQYFEEQDFDLDQMGNTGELTDKEHIFVDKYLGGDNLGASISEIKDPVSSMQVRSAAEPEHEHEPEGSEQQPLSMPASDPETLIQNTEPVRVKKEPHQAQSDKKQLEALEEIQLISFFIKSQEYALPIEKVKEVIKYIQPTQLPASPSYLKGVINLRQRVTPIISLSSLLSPGKIQNTLDRFIVVCHHDGLQMGLLVERIATMYRMPQDDVEWNVESALAMNASFVMALIKNREKIISILSIDTIVNHLLSK